MVRIDFFLNFFFLRSYLAKEKLGHSLFILQPPNFFGHFIGLKFQSLGTTALWSHGSHLLPCWVESQMGGQVSQENRSVRRGLGERERQAESQTSTATLKSA